MKHLGRIFLIMSLFIMAAPGHSQNGLKTGEIPPSVRLTGEEGQRVNGEPWSSDELRGKIFSFFYVDPSKRELNAPLEAAYEKREFPHDKHAGIAVINMAAAWYPNFFISSELEKKQKMFPRATYVKDFNKILVSKWGLTDKAVNVVVFDREGKVLYFKSFDTDPISAQEVTTIMGLIEKSL